MKDAASILKTTVTIYGGIFAAATILTLIFRKADWGRNMLTAILSWLAIFVIFLLASYAGETVFACLIAALSMTAVNEYYRLRKLRSRTFRVISIVLTGAAAVSALLGRTMVFYALPGISAMVFFSAHIALRSYDNVNDTVATALCGFIYWAWLPFHFVLLRRLEHGFGYVVLICTMIAFNDNVAYYTGKLLGKRSRKFSPRISPNKTWIGTIGGAAATILIGWLFRYTIPHLSGAMAVATAAVAALSIPMGDLIESAIKRDLGVKDSGNLIPGHGGVMDRFDSWVFTTPVMYYFLVSVTQIRR